MIFVLDTDVDTKDGAVQAFDKDVGVALIFYADVILNNYAAWVFLEDNLPVFDAVAAFKTDNIFLDTTRTPRTPLNLHSISSHWDMQNICQIIKIALRTWKGILFL